MGTYPSILRAPNPQFSYFLLALFGYFSLKYKKLWLLFIPIPFMYYFLFCTLCIFTFNFFLIYKTRLIRSNLSLLAANVAVFVILSCIVWFLFSLIAGTSGQLKAIGVLQLGRFIHLNVVGCFGFFLYGLLRITNWIDEKDKKGYILLSLVLCSFMTTNLQLVNGFALDLKDAQSMGIVWSVGLY